MLILVFINSVQVTFRFIHSILQLLPNLRHLDMLTFLFTLLSVGVSGLDIAVTGTSGFDLEIGTSTDLTIVI